MQCCHIRISWSILRSFYRAVQAIITDMHGQNRYLDARTCAGLTPLHMAAWAGHVEVAKILLANGAFLNPKIVFSSPSTSSVLPGSTPTHLATRKNRIHVVKALLAAYVCVSSHTGLLNTFGLISISFATLLHVSAQFSTWGGSG